MYGLRVHQLEPGRNTYASYKNEKWGRLYIFHQGRWSYSQTLQADINTAKFNVTGIYPTHDVLLTRDEAPLGFVVV